MTISRLTVRKLFQSRRRVGQRPGRAIDEQRRQTFECSSCFFFKGRHPTFHLRHRRVIGFRDVWRLQDADLQERRESPGRQRLDAASAGGR